jgi:hypothetical protein
MNFKFNVGGVKIVKKIDEHREVRMELGNIHYAVEDMDFAEYTKLIRDIPSMAREFKDVFLEFMQAKAAIVTEKIQTPIVEEFALKEGDMIKFRSSFYGKTLEAMVLGNPRNGQVWVDVNDATFSEDDEFPALLINIADIIEHQACQDKKIIRKSRVKG